MGRIKSAVTLAVHARKVIIQNAKDFAAFCSEKFAHNSYNPNLQQHFLEEFFFITNIEREEVIEAVISANTRSFYCIRSTGKPFIIEERGIMCL